MKLLTFCYMRDSCLDTPVLNAYFKNILLAEAVIQKYIILNTVCLSLTGISTPNPLLKLLLTT